MFIEKIGAIVSSPRRVVSTVFALIIVLAIPLTVLMVNQQQDLRQRAAGLYTVNGKVLRVNPDGTKTPFSLPGVKVKMEKRPVEGEPRFAVIDSNGNYTLNIFQEGLFAFSLDGLPNTYALVKSPAAANRLAFLLPPTSPLPAGTFNFEVRELELAPPIPTIPGQVTPPPGQTFKITGRVYRDTNRNGSHTTGEPGFNTTVNIRPKGGTTPVASSQTNNDLGSFSFSLPAGEYRVQANVLTGFEATSENPVPFLIGPDKVINIGIAPKVVTTPPPGDPLPKGWLDGASCQQFSGWTCDGSDWNRSVEVHFYKDSLADAGGTFIGQTTANVPREAAVASECGGKNAHGYVFSTPNIIEDGEEHNIYAYAVNQDNPIHANNTLLAGSPKTLTCGTAAPTPTDEPVPTEEPIPTEIPQPGDVLVNFAFTLPGIGGGSDPTRNSRPSTVFVYNSNNEVIASEETDSSYSNSVYSGSVNLGPIAPGPYTVKIKTDNSLRKAVPGIINLASGENNISTLRLTTGDINGNNQMDISDYNILISCIRSEALCTESDILLSDLNDDGTIDDGRDLNILFQAFAKINGD